MLDLTPAFIRIWCKITGRRHILQLYEGILGTGRPGATLLPKELINQALELLLSGVGNTMAIHSNRDWVWPYWVQRQLNAEDEGFIPTGVNVVTTNLSHRNWTSIASAGKTQEAMVDPVGMLSVKAFGWSLLPYLRVEGKTYQLPEFYDRVEQVLFFMDGDWGVESRIQFSEEIECIVRYLPRSSVDSHWIEMELSFELKGEDELDASAGFSIRPYNMLTMGPIHSLSHRDGWWRVNGRDSVFSEWKASRSHVSDRQGGDPILEENKGGLQKIKSRSGIIAGVYEKKLALKKGERVTLKSMISLEGEWVGNEKVKLLQGEKTENQAGLKFPDSFLSESFRKVASRMHIFDDGDVYTPGTFFYHQHWIRDSAFLMLADLNLGRFENIPRKIEHWFSKQRISGMFSSQKGEWDSTGQVLFLTVLAFKRMNRPDLMALFWNRLVKGANWILKTVNGRRGKLHGGLMPAGLSAEHFGPNDHYYWDNLWSLAGLKALKDVSAEKPELILGEKVLAEIKIYEGNIEASIMKGLERGQGKGLPSAPRRRVDSASVGNLVAVNPLHLVEVSTPWVQALRETLCEENLLKGMFFQGIIHTGLNPYLSIQLAKVMMMSDDEGYADILIEILRRGGKTYSWPEAIHPRTGGGCMGDGDHGWAIAELINLFHDMVALEERGRWVLGQGILESWFDKSERFEMTQVPVGSGRISASLRKDGGSWVWNWELLGNLKVPKDGLVLMAPMGKNERKQHMVTLPKGEWRFSEEKI